MMDYPEDQELWLKCLSKAEENFSKEHSKAIAKSVYLEHTLLPIFDVDYLIEQHVW